MPLLSFIYTIYIILRYDVIAALLCARVWQYDCLWTLLVVYVYNSRYLIWKFIEKVPFIQIYCRYKSIKKKLFTSQRSTVGTISIVKLLNRGGIKKENECEKDTFRQNLREELPQLATWFNLWNISTGVIGTYVSNRDWTHTNSQARSVTLLLSPETKVKLCGLYWMEIIWITFTLRESAPAFKRPSSRTLWRSYSHKVFNV